ncbi:MAG: hypothetical protein ACOY94_12305 [Bacillota bacterium]
MEQSEFRPRPAGELAILSYPHLPRELAGCQDHIFQLHEAEPVRVSECQSGYLQRAECLVCGKVTSRMDATWWTKTPAPETVAARRRHQGVEPKGG